MLKSISSLPKKQKRAVAKRTRVQRPSLTNDPVKVSVQAMVKPFDAPKGIASPLQGLTLPSQKFMAKASTAVVVPAGCTMVFMQSPCVSQNSTAASLVVAIQTASGTPMTGAWKNTVTGNLVVSGGTITALSTNTPYTGVTLSTGGYEWQNVSCGIRFNYDGTVLNQSGTFRYIHDPQFGYNQGLADWASKGPADILTYLDGTTNRILQNIVKNGIVEINASLPGVYGSPCEGTSYWPNNSGATIGGASGDRVFSTTPGLIGAYVNASTASISFHIEVVEHWAVAGPAVQALQTDSVSHPVLVDQVSNFLQSARQMHAAQPHSHHVSIMKSVKTSMGSPLGHEVLNAALTAALA